MGNNIMLSAIIIFIKLMSPIAMVLSIILFLSSSLFVDLEKKLSKEIGSNKLNRKTIKLLEEENMVLQNILLKYNRIVSIVIFIFAIIVFIRLYL